MYAVKKLTLGKSMVSIANMESLTIVKILSAKRDLLKMPVIHPNMMNKPIYGFWKMINFREASGK
jgi:hypothetical protein